MSRRPFGKLFGRAAIGPINLSVFGLAMFVAVALTSWPIAALGGAAYAALVAADVANPKFRRDVLLERARPARLPRVDMVNDPSTRALVIQMTTTRAEVDKMIAAMPERVRRNVSTTADSLAELEGHAAVLVARAEDLDRYLAAAPVGDADAEVARLRAQAAAARDGAARREYELAADAAQERTRALTEITASRDRIHANLARVAATMKAVPAKLVRLRALDDQASDAMFGDVGQELENMNIDLKAFEQTLEALAPVGIEIEPVKEMES